MNREEQLLMMKDDIKIPDSLNTIIDKEVKHYRTYRIQKNVYYLLMLLFLFGITCNLFPSVAYACEDIPVVKDFVKFVCMDKGVKDCIDNDYATYLHQTKGKNKKITLEYMIIDETQASFYLKGNDITEIKKVKFLEGEASQTILNYNDNYIKIQYMYKDIDKVEFLDYLSFQLENESYQFDILFHKDKIKKEKVIHINKKLNIDSQKLIVNQVKLYPCVAKVYLKEDLNNTMQLVDLKMTINGYGNVSNGVSMRGEDDYLVYMVESPYFNDDFSLKIESAFFCQKSDKYKIDINNKKIKNMKNVTLENMVINNNKLIIELSASYQDVNNTLVDSYYIDDKEYSCRSDMMVDTDGQKLHQIIEIPYKANKQYYLKLNYHKYYQVNREILKKILINS